MEDYQISQLNNMREVYKTQNIEFFESTVWGNIYKIPAEDFKNKPSHILESYYTVSNDPGHVYLKVTTWKYYSMQYNLTPNYI